MVTLNPDPGNGPIQEPGQEFYDVCIANISPRERLKRLMSGVIPFVFALGILSWMIFAGIDRLWRLPLFFLFAMAATGFFQWRDKT